MDYKMHFVTAPNYGDSLKIMFDDNSAQRKQLWKPFTFSLRKRCLHLWKALIAPNSRSLSSSWWDSQAFIAGNTGSPFHWQYSTSLQSVLTSSSSSPFAKTLPFSSLCTIFYAFCLWWTWAWPPPSCPRSWPSSGLMPRSSASLSALLRFMPFTALLAWSLVSSSVWLLTDT